MIGTDAMIMIDGNSEAALGAVLARQCDRCIRSRT
jgi:hypothetical protein